MRATAVLPVKRFGAAKSRLESLSGRRRRSLAAAMLEDVLESIGAARSVESTIVVSGEQGAGGPARAAGAELIDDPDEGHVEAALRGTQRAAELGARCVVLLPGDCPLLDPRELDGLIAAAVERCAIVVPDRHGAGTNALLLAPPDAIRPAFGEGSCERHCDRAREAGVPCSVERVDSLALDLDTPADLIALTRELESRPGRARRTARALGI